MRYDSVTMTCLTCGKDFAARGRRRYCSGACKQKAWRDHHAALPSPPKRRPRAETVYECPQCDARSLGERRCPDCNLFTRSLGPGLCPHCDEPIAISDIIADYQPARRS